MTVQYYLEPAWKKEWGEIADYVEEAQVIRAAGMLNVIFRDGTSIREYCSYSDMEGYRRRCAEIIYKKRLAEDFEDESLNIKIEY